MHNASTTNRKYGVPALGDQIIDWFTSPIFRLLFTTAAITLIFWSVYVSTEIERFRGNEFLDAGEWEIATFTLTNNVRLVFLIIITVVSAIIFNTIFYFADLLKIQAALREATGNGSKAIGLCFWLNLFALVICAGWLGGLIFQITASEAWNGPDILPSASRILDPLFASNIFALSLFVVFGIEDMILIKQTKSATNKAPAHPELQKALSYSRDSVYFIDLPVIGGSILLLILALWESHMYVLANGLTDSASFFFPSELARDPEYLDRSELMRKALNAPVNIGFSGGTHATQLFMSQVIFWILAFRNR